MQEDTETSATHREPDRSTLAVDPSRVARLRELYDLTPAEVRLTLLVVDGRPTREIADLLDISINTVRCHLRNIYVKSEVGGREALMRLVGETT